jgi:hypothetical protein
MAALLLGASIPQSGQAELVMNHAEQTLLEECAQAWLRLALIAPAHFMEELERSVWLSVFRPPLADDNAAAAAALKTLHSYREPEYRTIKPSLSARKLPAPEAELKFQKHQFNNIKRKCHGTNDYDPEDFENIQTQFLAYGQHSSTSGMVLSKKALAAKQDMEEQPDVETEATTFAGIPHLEISTEPILLRPDLPVLVSMPPPSIITAPTNKCGHGVTKARDGYGYSCSQCFEKIIPVKTRPIEHPMSLPFMLSDQRLLMVVQGIEKRDDFQNNYRDRLEIEENISTCELCGEKLLRWQVHYCADCWKTVTWTLEKKAQFTSEFYTAGASAKYQEKQAQKTKIKNLPPWNEVLEYLHIEIRKRYWSIPPDCEDLVGDLCDEQHMRMYFRMIPWVRTFVTRWWMVTHGFKIHEIEGYESTQLKHYFHRTGDDIRATLSTLRNAVNPVESVMSPSNHY